MTQTWMRFSRICSCISRGRLSHASEGPYAVFTRKTAPGTAASSMS